MAAHFGEIDTNSVVLRVVLAPSLEWCTTNLGGTWVQTANPNEPDPTDPDGVVYCGIGHGHDPAFVERFARPWQQPVTTVDDEGTPIAPYPTGSLVFHDGNIWRSLVAINVWEPGIANWRNVPLDGSVAAWQQPTGAGDAYAIGDEVTHDAYPSKGFLFRSLIAANTTVPGSDDRWWEALEAPDVDVPEWRTYDGTANTIYGLGEQVWHNGLLYESTVANNAGWEPGVVGGVWVLVDLSQVNDV